MTQQEMQWQPATIDLRFQVWLEAHPEALDEFVAIARRMKSKGVTRYSSDGILHIIRWNALVDGRDHQGYRCNNDFSSRLARLAMQRFEDLRGFFELRKLKGEGNEQGSGNDGGH